VPSVSAADMHEALFQAHEHQRFNTVQSNVEPEGMSCSPQALNQGLRVTARHVDLVSSSPLKLARITRIRVPHSQLRAWS